MKLLFDENLSYKLKGYFQKDFPGSSHVSDHHLINSIDSDIWSFAKAYDFTVVSQDADFFEMMMIKGFPPKIIWIKKGNCSTKTIVEMISRKVNTLLEFELNDDLGCLEIY